MKGCGGALCNRIKELFEGFICKTAPKRFGGAYLQKRAVKLRLKSKGSKPQAPDQILINACGDQVQNLQRGFYARLAKFCKKGLFAKFNQNGGVPGVLNDRI